MNGKKIENLILFVETECLLMLYYNASMNRGHVCINICKQWFWYIVSDSISKYLHSGNSVTSHRLSKMVKIHNWTKKRYIWKSRPFSIKRWLQRERKSEKKQFTPVWTVFHPLLETKVTPERFIEPNIPTFSYLFDCRNWFNWK